MVRFLKADTKFMNMRPLRYSYIFDSPPNSLRCIPNQKGLKLRDALLVSYHHNEVRNLCTIVLYFYELFVVDCMISFLDFRLSLQSSR